MKDPERSVLVMLGVRFFLVPSVPFPRPLSVLPSWLFPSLTPDPLAETATQVRR